MDIWIDAPYPACQISNFARNEFDFEDVHVVSMEGFIQAVKFRDIEEQRLLCGLEGIIAKKRGTCGTLGWQRDQTLHWRGVEYPRKSIAYQLLLDRAFLALCEQSEAFRVALAATGQEPLTHKIGHTELTETVLTQYEFCSRLSRLRSYLALGLTFGKKPLDSDA